MNSLSKHPVRWCSAAALIALCLATSALGQEIEEDEPVADVAAEPPRTTERRTRSTRPPAMIGDFFGSGQSFVCDFEAESCLPIPNPSASGAVIGRVKVAENTSPFPQDRVFFNYSYFDNVALTPGGVAVNRFVPGIERTFFDSQMSLEFRFPFAATLDSDILADGLTPTGRGEFGNISLIGKKLLSSNESLTTSAGLQLTLPTASDTRVLFLDGTELVKVENASVHLMPFAAAAYTPNDSVYAQAFLQFDFDANGNPLSAASQGLGRLNEPAYVYFDISLGWFMYQSASPSSRLTGITPIVELHYNRSLQSGDVVSAGGFTIGDFRSTFESLNIVAGAAFQFGPSSSFTVGYTAPIGGGSDQVFDGELRAFFTYYLR